MNNLLDYIKGFHKNGNRQRRIAFPPFQFLSHSWLPLSYSFYLTQTQCWLFSVMYWRGLFRWWRYFVILKELSRVWWYLIPAKWIIPFRRRFPETKRRLCWAAGAYIILPGVGFRSLKKGHWGKVVVKKSTVSVNILRNQSLQAWRQVQDLYSIMLKDGISSSSQALFWKPENEFKNVEISDKTRSVAHQQQVGRHVHSHKWSWCYLTSSESIQCVSWAVSQMDMTVTPLLTQPFVTH